MKYIWWIWRAVVTLLLLTWVGDIARAYSRITAERKARQAEAVRGMVRDAERAERVARNRQARENARLAALDEESREDARLAALDEESRALIREEGDRTRTEVAMYFERDPRTMRQRMIEQQEQYETERQLRALRRGGH